MLGRDWLKLGVKLYSKNGSQCNVLTSTAAQTCVCVFVCVPTVWLKDDKGERAECLLIWPVHIYMNLLGHRVWWFNVPKGVWLSTRHIPSIFLIFWVGFFKRFPYYTAHNKSCGSFILVCLSCRMSGRLRQAEFSILAQFLPSGKLYRSIRTRANRFKDSFYPTALPTLNKAKHSPSCKCNKGSCNWQIILILLFLLIFNLILTLFFVHDNKDIPTTILFFWGQRP